MIDLDITAYEELERRLLPVLKRRGLSVESIQLIGLLGRGASSSVFSLLINHKYYVLKLYYSHTSFLREMRNRRRLIWPPRVFLTSHQNENSLGYDLVITEVPEGGTFNSTHLVEWVQEKMAEHLTELHRLRRKQRVSISGLRRSINDTEHGARKAAIEYGEGAEALVNDILHKARVYLEHNSAVLRVQGSLLHNDLWWDNIIIAKDDVYLVDWESMRVGDYAEDLAFMRVMIDFTPGYDAKRSFWRTSRDEAVANRFFAGIVEQYRHFFDDDQIDDRLRFYLVLQTLRRLSDIASGTYLPNRDLVGLWLGQLNGFWEHGLDVAD